MIANRPLAAAGALALLAAFAWLAQRPACCAAPVAAAAVFDTPAGAPASAPTRADANAPSAAPARAAPREDAPSPTLPALATLLRTPPAQWREGVQQALARPGEGGRLYARHLLRQCAAADLVAGLHAPEGDDPGRASTPDASDPRAARATARMQQLRAACAQFTPAELAAGANVVSNAGADADPLLALVGTSPADDRAQLRRVLARPDPLVLQELGPRLALHTASGQQAYWFDGQRVAPDIAEPALALLPCAFGLPCDESDPDVWMPCLQGIACATSRTELVLQQAAAGDATRREQILALSRRMAQAVRAADVERFSAATPP